MRISIHTTLDSSPRAVVVSRDIRLNVSVLAGWHAITQKREHFINYQLMWQNVQRQRYDYTIHQKVLEKVHDPTKLGIRASGTRKTQPVNV